MMGNEYELGSAWAGELPGKTRWAAEVLIKRLVPGWY